MSHLFKLVLKLGIPFALFSCFATAAQACWVQKIENVNGVARVYLGGPYKSLIPQITRPGLGVVPPPDESPGYFELQVGDHAIAWGGAHDLCNYTAEIRDGRLGVFLAASSRPHGFPPSSSTAFVIAEPARP